MIWSGDRVARYVEISDESQIQPNGVDLSVGEVYEFKSGGLLGKKRELPEYRLIEPGNNGIYMLSPGPYLVRYKEVVRIPSNAIGLVFPRSSLQRIGATIYTSVWDSGYEGRGVGLMVVFNPNGIRLERGAKICQIIFIDAKSSSLYSGVYKYEGVKIRT